MLSLKGELGVGTAGGKGEKGQRGRRGFKVNEKFNSPLEV